MAKGIIKIGKTLTGTRLIFIERNKIHGMIGFSSHAVCYISLPNRILTMYTIKEVFYVFIGRVITRNS